MTGSNIEQRLAEAIAYRDADGAVRFMELNAVSARLVDLVAGGNMTGVQACRRIAEEFACTDTDAVIRHGAQLLGQLHEAGALSGVAT